MLRRWLCPLSKVRTQGDGALVVGQTAAAWRWIIDLAAVLLGEQFEHLQRLFDRELFIDAGERVLEQALQFFGRDVLHYPDPRRVLLFNHNQSVALYRADELAILGLHKSAQSVLHRRDPARPARDRDRYERIPDDAPLVELATAYYQVGSGMFQAGAYP